MGASGSPAILPSTLAKDRALAGRKATRKGDLTLVEPGKAGGKQGADGTSSGMVAAMSRLARVVGVGVAHHVT
jgi:hypothetical protein